jgi:hypothetical protein
MTRTIIALLAGAAASVHGSLPQPETPTTYREYSDVTTPPSISLIDTRNFLPPTMELQTRALLIHAAADSAGLQVRHIDENLMLVQSGDDGESRAKIDQLMALLKQIQATAPTYRVSVRVLKFPIAEAPAVGAMVGPDKSMVLAETMVRGSTETTIESIEEIGYIEGWSPIVGNVAAYEARIATAEQGFRGVITIQSSETPDTVRFSMTGEVKRVSLSTIEQPVIAPDQRLSFTLPRTHRRSLEVNIESLATRQPTTISMPDGSAAPNLVVMMEPSYLVTCVFEGIDPNECFAIAVRVMPVP